MEFTLAIFTSVYLGLITSISPCPLATNIVAISYISKEITHPGLVFLRGVIYSIGRSIAYILVGFIVIKALLDAPYISHFIQKYMGKILGPVLIVVGMFLLEWIKLNLNFSVKTEKLNQKGKIIGLWGSFLLGVRGR
ncbi:MAG TPA: sulfite exporter TauE/SafE family protein [Candidatus Hydrogenedens sp.]|nr:sulfite exporter TauE/SafE family protein [Candidatus Hydrogenedens sp.]